MITTKHVDKMRTVTVRNKQYDKPVAVMDYNAGKSYIDMSDQMGAYSNCLRKTVKWYRKVAFDLLLNVSIVNAWSIYKTVTNKNCTITTFKEDIVKLCIYTPSPEAGYHELLSHLLVANNKRVRCPSCYKKSIRELGRRLAQKKCQKDFY